MRLSEGKSKIVGLQLGEAMVNFIRPDLPPIKAKLALLAEDGSACGFIEKSNGWSERTQAALQALAEAVEEDALQHVFVVDEATKGEEKAEETPQF